MTNFNRLMQLTSAQQVKLLGGVAATFQNNTDSISVTVIIDRDVEVMAENGMSTVKRTIINLKKSEVGKVSRNDKIVYGCETFSVESILSDDGIIIEVFVRG